MIAKAEAETGGFDGFEVHAAGAKGGFEAEAVAGTEKDRALADADEGAPLAVRAAGEGEDAQGLQGLFHRIHRETVALECHSPVKGIGQGVFGEKGRGEEEQQAEAFHSVHQGNDGGKEG